MANESTIRIRSLKFFLTEIYKLLNGLSPPMLKEVFQINDSRNNLRNPTILASKTQIYYKTWL